MVANSMGKTVGMIGTGLMGSAMTRRLMAQGFTVEGFDPSPEAAERFKALGGIPHGSLASLASSVERAVISVFNSDQVEDVVEGNSGIVTLAPTARKLSLLINTSTCEPDRMAEAESVSARKASAICGEP